MNNVFTSLPTAAILKYHHTIRDTPQSIYTKTQKSEIYKIYSRGGVLNRPPLPHPGSIPPLRVQLGWAQMQRRYSALLFTPFNYFFKETQLKHFILTPSAGRGFARSPEPTRSEQLGEGDRVSCRGLECSVFMAAAGRDVSLAPSIQLPSTGFPPVLLSSLLFPAEVDLAPYSLPLPLLFSLSSSLTLITRVTCNMNLEHAYSKNIYRHRGPPPLWHGAGLLFVSTL